jgi:hypothetical protein
MLTEEAPHVRGQTGINRIIQRTCGMKAHKTDDVRALGAIDPPTMRSTSTSASRCRSTCSAGSLHQRRQLLRWA